MTTQIVQLTAQPQDLDTLETYDPLTGLPYDPQQLVSITDDTAYTYQVTGAFEAKFHQQAAADAAPIASLNTSEMSPNRVYRVTKEAGTKIWLWTQSRREVFVAINTTGS